MIIQQVNYQNYIIQKIIIENVILEIINAYYDIIVLQLNVKDVQINVVL